MTLNELQSKTQWKRVASNKDALITGLFAGDLLSYVMGHAQEGQVWVTLQSHVNSIGVAHLKELSAIVLIDSIDLEEDARLKALEHDIPVFISPLDMVETLRCLMALGL